MSLSPELIRRELYSYYPGSAWKLKVDSMSDKQAAAVLIRLQSSKKSKHGKTRINEPRSY